MSRRPCLLFPIWPVVALLFCVAWGDNAFAAAPLTLSNGVVAEGLPFHAVAGAKSLSGYLSPWMTSVLAAAPASQVQAVPYMDLWKLLSIVVTFMFWVWATDWLNRDAVRIAKAAEISPELWNLAGVLSLLGGLLAAILIPVFWVGFPIMVIAAITPVISYRLVRRKKSAESETVKRILNPSGDGQSAKVLAQDEGVAMTITPDGANSTQQQAALIKARQSSGFVDFKELLYQGQFKRADVIQIDYSQTQAAPRLFVDGMWHALEAMDRPRGDAMLVSLKRVAGMDPKDRQSKQAGKFAIKSELGKVDLQVKSSGSKSGEMIRVVFNRASKNVLSLPELGMQPAMAEPFKKALNEPGICIVSAPKKQGLTTTWQGTLRSSDRLTRDCIALVDSQETESDIENIGAREFESDATAVDFLRKTLVSQPNSIAVPRVVSAELMDLLSDQANQEERSVWLRTNASSAAEALLRSYSLAGDRGKFRSAVKYVTCQRLVRRLCEQCKQDVPVSPKMIQQLGGDPAKVKSIAGPWKLPPPEQCVDEKGRKIEFPTCEACGGIGYVGRVAIFEMITVNDVVREALRKTPKVAAIDAAAKQSKAKQSLKSSAFQLVLSGLTSFQEVQDVLKKK